MHFKNPILPLIAAGVLCAAILSSCSGGRIGYGVVLRAGDKSSVKTGQVVTVKSESKINSTYTIDLAGSKAPVKLPMWRIKRFSNEKEAVNYSLAYAAMVPLVAKTAVNGASIRDTANAAATRVYRLREGQIVKVISKESNQVTIDGVNGYWYQVLTGDGVLGYCFGPNLTVYNPALQTLKQASVGQLLLQKVLATTYRPQYFQQMIANNRIDLQRFSPKYGFFVDTQAKTVQIVMPDYALKFSYSEVKELAQNDYSFAGTPIEMTIKSPEEVQLLYSDSHGNQYDQVFVKIKQDIGYLVEKEKNRQLQVYAGFLDKSPFSSDYYGTISLEPDMGFTWSGFSRLVPDIIPAGAGSTGVVAFSLYLSNALEGQYDGVITFEFGATPNAAAIAALKQAAAQLPTLSSIAPAGSPAAGSQPAGSPTGIGPSVAQTQPSSSSTAQSVSSSPTTSVSFLYSFAGGGVRLTYVPPSTISKDTVASVSSTPIIIFFSFKGTGG